MLYTDFGEFYTFRHFVKKSRKKGRGYKGGVPALLSPNFRECISVFKNSFTPVSDPRLGTKTADSGAFSDDLRPSSGSTSTFSTGWYLLGTGVKIAFWRRLHFHAVGVALARPWTTWVNEAGSGNSVRELF
jgi:hypothetical protein